MMITIRAGPEILGVCGCVYVKFFFLQICRPKNFFDSLFVGNLKKKIGDLLQMFH